MIELDKAAVEADSVRMRTKASSEPRNPTEQEPS